MKKVLFSIAVAVMLVSGISAEGQNEFTINTRAWSTNYWNHIIYGAARGIGSYLAGKDNPHDSLLFECIVPENNLVFPVGIEKAGFEDPNDIYGPYHRAFGTPFKRMGDFGVGLDVSWKPWVIGLYAGAYYKSQEVWFKAFDNNLRGFYFQPRGGVVLGGEKWAVEGGVFYDKVLGCGGNYKGDKEMLLGGLGLDFSFGYTTSAHNKTMIMFSMPLHNFFNEDYANGVFQGMKRRVGYIMLTHRVIL
ncbi:MAG: hypothetical protein J5641_00820 [Bacteroidales bacterium]|nr:hypothetical protein [Bacteroidales bacterium]